MVRLLMAVAAVLVLVAAALLFEPSDARPRTKREGATAAALVRASAPPSAPGPDASPGHGSRGGARTEGGSEATDHCVVGRVTDESGAPIAGANVSIANYMDPFRPGDVFTDAAGRFAVPCTVKTPSRVAMLVKHEDYVPLCAVNRATGPGLVLVMTWGLRITGRARFPDGTPAVGVAVDGGTGTVRTNERGEFTLRGFEPGPVIIGCEGVSTVSEVEAGSSNLEFVLDQSIVRVEAVDDNGEPVRHGRWRGHVGPHRFANDLDAHGRASIVTFPGQLGWVVVDARGYVPVRLVVSTRSEEARLHALKAVMRPDSDTILRIRVLAPPDPAPAPRTVRVEQLDDDGVPLRSEEADLTQGVAVIEGLPVGTVRLRVSARWQEVACEKDVPIQRGDGNDAEFSMPASGLLRVRWQSPARGWDLALESADGRRLSTWFGEMSVADVLQANTPIPLGRYRLLERNLGKVVRERVVELTSTGTTTIDWIE